MEAKQREELRRLADQCICHPVSRGVREVEQAGEAIKDLLDALEAAEKDAARYQWLRSVPNGLKAQRIVNDTPQGMDAAIDKAMEAK